MASPVNEQSKEAAGITDVPQMDQDSRNEPAEPLIRNASPEAEQEESQAPQASEVVDAQSRAMTAEFKQHAGEAGGSAFHVVRQAESSITNESSGDAGREDEDADSNNAGTNTSEEISGKIAKHFAAQIVEQHKLEESAAEKEVADDIWQRQTDSAAAGDENDLLGITKSSAAEVERELEEIDDAVENILLAEDDEDSCGKEKAIDTNEGIDMSEAAETSLISDIAILKPSESRDGVTDSSAAISGVDNDDVSELRRQHTVTVHKPERVYDIDEETRMGLDQTPVDPTLADASFIYPSLPPKKLFQLDDKECELSDSETKMSNMTDTEDIRLRNTISIDDATKDSAASDSNMDTPTPSRKQRRASREGLGISMMEGIETIHPVYTAENLFEYQWPQDGGEWHMLQEQISEYLKVKSFKRKYPDLYRRICDKEEKDFLRERGVVTETQSDLGLTALRSEEVYDLMMKDYNDNYKEYISHLQEKQKKVIHEKQKEYSAQARLDKSKIESYSKKAARSAAEFNASLMREKKEERRAYFDLQTYTIHFPKKKFGTLPPRLTKVGAYPVALIGGQYQENYRKFTPEELKYYPVMTTLKDPPKPIKYVRPPPPGLKMPGADKQQKATGGSDGEESSPSSVEEVPAVEETPEPIEAENKENQEAPVEEVETPVQTPVKVEKEKKPKSSSKKKTPKATSPERPKKQKKSKEEKGEEKNDDKSSQEDDEKGGSSDSKKMPAKIHGLEKCRICKKRSTKEERENDMLVKCAECGKIGHMGCLDLTEELVAVIKTYPWQCMECKTCVECLDPYDEDKMMFCDRCDRGYHTFCIGLDALPTGHWECKSCEGCPKILPRPKKKKVKPPKEPVSETASSEVKPEIKEEDEVKDGEGQEEKTEKPPQEDQKDAIPVPEKTGEETIQEQSEDVPLSKEKEEIVAETDRVVVKTKSSVSDKAAKIEKRGRKRKNPDSTPAKPKKPKLSKEDRIQGARQSRRLKLKEEEEEEKKKKEDEEKKLKKKKKKKKLKEGMKEEAMEAGEVGGDKISPDESLLQDDFRDIVSEGVDDSAVFDKNDDEEKDMEVEKSSPQNKDETLGELAEVSEKTGTDNTKTLEMSEKSDDVPPGEDAKSRPSETESSAVAPMDATENVSSSDKPEPAVSLETLSQPEQQSVATDSSETSAPEVDKPAEVVSAQTSSESLVPDAVSDSPVTEDKGQQEKSSHPEEDTAVTQPEPAVEKSQSTEQPSSSVVPESSSQSSSLPSPPEAALSQTEVPSQSGEEQHQQQQQSATSPPEAPQVCSSESAPLESSSSAQLAEAPESQGSAPLPLPSTKPTSSTESTASSVPMSSDSPVPAQVQEAPSETDIQPQSESNPPHSVSKDTGPSQPVVPSAPPGVMSDEMKKQSKDTQSGSSGLPAPQTDSTEYKTHSKPETDRSQQGLFGQNVSRNQGFPAAPGMPTSQDRVLEQSLPSGPGVQSGQIPPDQSQGMHYGAHLPQGMPMGQGMPYSHANFYGQRPPVPQGPPYGQGMPMSQGRPYEAGPGMPMPMPHRFGMPMPPGFPTGPAGHMGPYGMPPPPPMPEGHGMPYSQGMPYGQGMPFNQGMPMGHGAPINQGYPMGQGMPSGQSHGLSGSFTAPHQAHSSMGPGQENVRHTSSSGHSAPYQGHNPESGRSDAGQ